MKTILKQIRKCLYIFNFTVQFTTISLFRKVTNNLFQKNWQLKLIIKSNFLHLFLPLQLGTVTSSAVKTPLEKKQTSVHNVSQSAYELLTTRQSQRVYVICCSLHHLPTTIFHIPTYKPAWITGSEAIFQLFCLMLQFESKHI